MLSTIRNWIKSKGGAAHLVALSWAFLVAAYAMNSQFHAFVAGVEAALPGWAEDGLTLVVSLWAFYKTWKPAPPPNLSSTIPPAATLLIVFALLIPFAGCKGPTATAPLAPGYVIPAEQAVGETIAGANAAVLKYEADVRSGAYTPTPAIRAAIGATREALVISDPLAVAWHAQLLAAQATIAQACATEPAGTCTAAVVQSRIAAATAEPAALASEIAIIVADIGKLPAAAQ